MRFRALVLVLVLGCSTTSTPASTTSTSSATTSSTTSTTTTSTTAPQSTTTSTVPLTLAQALTAAERAIRDPATPNQELASHAQFQQETYRALVAEESLARSTRQGMPEDLLADFDANLLAGHRLRSLTRPQESLPDWRIVAPPPPEELLTHYRAAEETFGVPWEYLAAIHLVETRMGRIRGDSPAGARGPMQFLPSTWAAYGEGDIEDPRESIMAAARYLVAHGAPGDVAGALWAYNHAHAYVEAITAYAQVMERQPRTYFGYYHWRVFYRTTSGDVLLAEGYGS